ncbi:MAG: flavin reductase [Clostridia bacterium]|nr:flavin reductase [Clostridia bacterium]
MANIDATALFNISYGLYALTVNDGTKDNGLIVNTAVQITSNSPLIVSVTVNKANYSHEVIQKTGKLNINCLSVKAPFSVFEALGFRSGRDTDKMKDISFTRSENGLAVLSENVNAFISLEVINEVDVETHTVFICRVTESAVLNKDESMTYSYYHKNVKPKPQPKLEAKKGYICKICGYVYEGDPLPEDFVCPLCKHGAEDFEPIE